MMTVEHTIGIGVAVITVFIILVNNWLVKNT